MYCQIFKWGLLTMLKENQIVIYGAQAIAYSTYKAMAKRGKDTLAFVVTKKEGNPERLDGIPVLSMREFFSKSQDNKKLPIYIATPESVQSEISNILKTAGCLRIECLTSERFGALLEAFFADTSEFMPLIQAETQDDMSNAVSIAEMICIYQAVHEKDRQLARDYVNDSWVKPIQVGAALAGQRFDDMLHDDAGKNISAKNRAYAELTALYWAWHNSPAQVIGLAHYRRLLDINASQLRLLQANKLDAILPYPMSYFPQSGMHHKRWVRDEDWEAIMRAMREIYPEYAKAVPNIFAGEYFYNYNLLCARREVMDAYCSWLFAICDRAQRYIGSKEPSAMYKYFGYGGESLCDIFFMYNKDKYRLAHTAALMRI